MEKERFGFTIMNFEEPQMKITWVPYDAQNTVEYERYTDERHPLIPYEIWNMTGNFHDVMNYLEKRCFPRTRIGVEELLKEYGLKFYDPLQICRKSHGRSMTNYMWLKFTDEPDLTFEQIRLR